MVVERQLFELFETCVPWRENCHLIVGTRDGLASSFGRPALPLGDANLLSGTLCAGDNTNMTNLLICIASRLCTTATDVLINGSALYRITHETTKIP